MPTDTLSHEPQPLSANQKKALQGKKIYYIGPPGTFAALGKLLPHQVQGEPVPRQDYNYLTPELFAANLEKIKRVKPDAVVIYDPGITSDHPSQKLLIKKVMQTLTDMGIKTVLAEYDAPTCAMKPAPEGVTLLNDTRPEIIVAGLAEAFGTPSQAWAL